MELYNEELQKTAVEKVLDEMKRAEEFLIKWNCVWFEQLLDAHCLPFHYEVGEADVRDIEKKYEPRYRLANAYYSEDSIGIPLAKENVIGNNTLTGEENLNFECDFGRIDWYGINSNRAIRRISFNNNGEINFSKKVKPKQKKKHSKKNSIKHPKEIHYETTYNVLSNDFIIKIELTEHDKCNDIMLCLQGGILTEKYNDILIIHDLNKGIKTVKIEKKRDKTNKNNNASVVFEAILNNDDSLRMGAIAINTYKGNGKVNGTYRFDVSKEKGVRANFISRKGIKVDLTNNPMLLNTAKTLLLSSNNYSSGDLVVTEFSNSTQNTIAKNLEERVICFDNSDFNMEALKEAENTIMQTLKGIKGELPLYGLVERIDNCISILENIKEEKNKEKIKSLKLENNK